jgi:hypothetical protein
MNSEGASPNDYNLTGLISKNQQTEQQLKVLHQPFPPKSS